MIEHGLILMVVGMGTVGAFLTTMVFLMNLSAAIIKTWFPEKSKPSAKKPKPKTKKASATKKAATTKPEVKKEQ